MRELMVRRAEVMDARSDLGRVGGNLSAVESARRSRILAIQMSAASRNREFARSFSERSPRRPWSSPAVPAAP